MKFHQKNNLNMMFMSGSGKRLITWHSCNRKFSYDAYGFWGNLRPVDELGLCRCYDFYVSCNAEHIKQHRVLIYKFTSCILVLGLCVADNWCEWEESIFMIIKWNHDLWRLCPFIWFDIWDTKVIDHYDISLIKINHWKCWFCKRPCSNLFIFCGLV